MKNIVSLSRVKISAEFFVWSLPLHLGAVHGHDHSNIKKHDYGQKNTSTDQLGKENNG